MNTISITPQLSVISPILQHSKLSFRLSQLSLTPTKQDLRLTLRRSRRTGKDRLLPKGHHILLCQCRQSKKSASVCVCRASEVSRWPILGKPATGTGAQPVSIQKSEGSGWSGQPSAVSDQLNDLFLVRRFLSSHQHSSKP